MAAAPREKASAEYVAVTECPWWANAPGSSSRSPPPRSGPSPSRRAGCPGNLQLPSTPPGAARATIDRIHRFQRRQPRASQPISSMRSACIEQWTVAAGRRGTRLLAPPQANVAAGLAAKPTLATTASSATVPRPMHTRFGRQGNASGLRPGSLVFAVAPRCHPPRRNWTVSVLPRALRRSSLRLVNARRPSLALSALWPSSTGRKHVITSSPRLVRSPLVGQ